MVSKGTVIGVIVFIIGLLIFVDDLHDFVPGTDMFHWLPDFLPVIINGIHLDHLFLGIIIMVIGLIVGIKYRD